MGTHSLKNIKIGNFVQLAKKSQFYTIQCMDSSLKSKSEYENLAIISSDFPSQIILIWGPSIWIRLVMKLILNHFEIIKVANVCWAELQNLKWVQF